MKGMESIRAGFALMLLCIGLIFCGMYVAAPISTILLGMGVIGTAVTFIVMLNIIIYVAQREINHKEVPIHDVKKETTGAGKNGSEDPRDSESVK